MDEGQPRLLVVEYYPLLVNVKIINDQPTLLMDEYYPLLVKIIKEQSRPLMDERHHISSSVFPLTVHFLKGEELEKKS